MLRRWRGTLPGWAALALLAVAGPAGAADDVLRAEARRGPGYLLVEFVSATCPACDEMRPVVEQVLAARPGLRFRSVDADLEAALSRAYGVKCVPVYVVLGPDGTVRFNEVGMRTADELDEILEQAGAGGR